MHPRTRADHVTVSPRAALFLRQAVAEVPRPDLLERGPLPGLVEAARVHRVQGYAVRSLRADPGAAPEQLEELLRDYALATVLHARALDGLREVATILDDAGVSWLAVKGPVLTEALHGGAGMRSYGDLDVVVAPGDLGRALAALEAAGARPVPISWRHLFDQRAGELPVRLTSGQVLDLHWHIVNSGQVRRGFAIGTGPLLERSVAVEVGAVEVRTTDPVDTLLHLCVHATISGGNRLIWLKDVQLAARAVGERWDDVVARAEAWRAGLVLAVLLTRTRDVLGLELPAALDPVLAAGRCWLPVTKLAGRVRPMERSLGAASLERMVTRATGTSPRSSWGALTKKVARGMSSRLLGISNGPPQPDEDDLVWRAAFLDAVAGQP